MKRRGPVAGIRASYISPHAWGALRFANWSPPGNPFARMLARGGAKLNEDFGRENDKVSEIQISGTFFGEK